MWIKIDDLDLSAYGIYVINDEGIKQSPAVEVKTVVLPGGPTIDMSTRLSPISFSLELGLRPAVPTNANLITAINSLISLLYPNLETNHGYHKFEYEGNTGKCVYVRTSQGYKFPRQWPISERRVGRLTVSFDTLTSYWQSSSASTVTVNSGQASTTVANDGNFVAYPTYTFTFGATVTSVNISISGVSLTVTGSFTTSDTLTINSETKEIKKNTSLIAAGAFSGIIPSLPTGNQTVTKTTNNVALSISFLKRYKY